MAETTKNKKYKPETTKKAAAAPVPVPVAEPLSDGDTILDGFNPTQIVALARVKEAVARGEYSDLTPEFKKLLFVKWLVEHDRIGS